MQPSVEVERAFSGSQELTGPLHSFFLGSVVPHINDDIGAKFTIPLWNTLECLRSSAVGLDHGLVQEPQQRI